MASQVSAQEQARAKGRLLLSTKFGCAKLLSPPDLQASGRSTNLMAKLATMLMSEADGYSIKTQELASERLPSRRFIFWRSVGTLRPVRPGAT